MNSLTENQLEAGKKSWADNDLLNELLRSSNIECPDGSLILELGPNGWVIQVATGGNTACAAIITGKTGTDYDVDLYGDGLDSTKTGTATMQIVEIHINDVVPTGTKVIAYPTNVSITSGWGPS